MAQKKYGDLVEYVHNAQELITNEQGARVRVTSSKTSNALVISSSIHEGREQLQILYLDESYNRPFLGGSDVQSAIKTVFTYPLVESAFQGTPAVQGQPTIPPPAAAQGWKETEVLTEDQIHEMQLNFATAQFQDDEKWKAQVEALEAQIASDAQDGGKLRKDIETLNQQKLDLMKQLNPLPTLTDDEVYAQVKAGLTESGQVIEPNGALLSQVFAAVNRFLKEQSEAK